MRGGVSLSFEGLGVSYGRTEILRGISGEFAPGHFVALIGPNGSGKSTLLKALCGLLPYGGSVRLGGRELKGFSRSELGRTIAMLPQKIQMDSSFSVYDLIALGRLPHQKLLARPDAEDDLRVLNAAGVMAIEHILFKNASHLSGGEAQRALMAMVLAQDPDIFLLDEPNSASDIKHSARIFSMLRETAASGRLVVAAVHDVNTALRFADSFVAIKGGEILRAETMEKLDSAILEELYDTPFERFESEDKKCAWHAC